MPSQSGNGYDDVEEGKRGKKGQVERDRKWWKMSKEKRKPDTMMMTLDWEKITRNIEKSTRLTHNEGQVYPLHSLRYALPFGPPKIRPYRNRNVQPKARSAVINNP